MATKFEIEKGPFEPTWESLRQFTCPDWFRDAKLGIWAHWGPQCLPMYGDWYARNIYIEGSDQYRFHWRTYGVDQSHLRFPTELLPTVMLSMIASEVPPVKVCQQKSWQQGCWR